MKVKNIEHIITRSGFKKGFIADRMNMTRPTLQSRINNPETFTVADLKKLASILLIPVAELIDFD